MIYFLFFSFLFSVHTPQAICKIDGSFFLYDTDLYQVVGRSAWSQYDHEKKEAVFNDFLKKELVCFSAKETFFNLRPEIIKKIKVREKMLLINNSYEHFVARPRLDSSLVSKTLKGLSKSAFVSHVLIGFEGAQNYRGEQRTKKEAESLILFLKNKIASDFSSCKNEGCSLGSLFSASAKELSDDPSVQKNGGFLGSVFWGTTINSFERVVFNLSPNSLSSPFETPFGYHLALVDSFGLSDYHYYPKEVFQDLSIKVSLGSLSFDSLKLHSSLFDSLVFNEGGVVLNSVFISSVFNHLLKKQKEERLIGNKFSTLGWLEDFNKKGVLVVFNNKGYGLNWFLNILRELPATRVPSIKTREDFVLFIKGVCLESLVLNKAKKEGVDFSVSFLKDLKNNSKNILYNEYVGFLVGSSGKNIDSLVVKKAYKDGVFNGDFLSPFSVVVSEVRFLDSLMAGVAFSEFLSLNDFDVVLKKYSGTTREPIPENKGGAIGLRAFSLKEGDVSSVLKNPDGSFSFFRVERFLKKEPFSLDLVYKQIERKLIKKEQDFLKQNLLSFLLKKHKVDFYYDVLDL